MDHLHVPVSYIGGGGVQCDQYDAYKNANHWAPIVRHATFLLGGFVMVLLLHNIPCRFFSAFIILLPVSMLMLIVTPFIGVDANDAHRWLEIMGIQFQPSEFGKLACVVFVAFLLSKRGKLTENQIFKYILIGVGLTCVLILPETFLRRLCYSGFVS